MVTVAPDVVCSHRPGPRAHAVPREGCPANGSSINGVKILEGRMYNPKAPNEIVPSFGVAHSPVRVLDLGRFVSFEDPDGIQFELWL